MKKNVNEIITSRIDLLQQSSWNNEEQSIKILGNISKHQADIVEIKNCLELLMEKIDRIEAEIRGLRNGN